LKTFDLRNDRLGLGDRIKRNPGFEVANENWQHFQQWWQAQGQQWLEDLRQVMVHHRNIGHDWQFNQQQKQQLQRYYDANCFLVKLMKIKGAVSENVQAEIEDSLLLPWDELQRRYPETYGNL